jgi:alanine racemase
MTNRPCWAEIYTKALAENYQILRGLAPAGAECMAVVKADAYGHSLAICVPALVGSGSRWGSGARWLGVTSAEEAVAARALAPQARIYIMGGLFPGQAEAVVKHCLTPSVWTVQQIDELEEAAGQAGSGKAGPEKAGSEAESFPVHLEIDTGMSRQGVGLGELSGILARFTPDSPLRIEALMTHLYASDESDHVKSGVQLARLEEALGIVRAANPEAAAKVEFLSAGSSAALIGGDAGAVAGLAARFGLKLMLRLGLALYGVAPRCTPARELSAQPLKSVLTKSVMTWKTRVASVREVPAGAEIGYNGTFTVTEPMRLALLPAGYADGLDRRLGNRFSLLVRGALAPLVGRVSMDQSVIDVTEIEGVEAGDEVVILGAQISSQTGSQAGSHIAATVTAQDHADASGTIPWEVFTRIAARVERVAV